ncbi:transglutaminase family protein [Desulfobulbus sp.]|uniref:transglutaminase family protein n=1 Tax=Desulfobulbus sp. TaxID=895 RepID=UPI0027B97CEE|nr:transglutaminase family protein [Desulfobulbus sp.]
MKYRITHTTAYQYSEPASLSQNELFLTPRATARQQVLQAELVFDPQPQYLHRRIDYFDNIAHVFMVQQPHKALSLTAVSIVRTGRAQNPDAAATLPWETAVQRLVAHLQPEELDASQFVFPSPMISINPAILDYARISFPPGRPVLEGGLDLMGRIFNEFAYDKSASTVDTPVTQVLATRRGVCQDFSHLAIACLRSLGLAARYVSGYLETLPPPGKIKLVGADASHAWVALYVPDEGWVDLDPTNNVLAGESHVTLAWGRDYSDVAPVKGVVMGGGVHTLSVEVDVARVG